MASSKQNAATSGRPISGGKGTKAGQSVMTKGTKTGAAGTKC